MPHSVSSSFYLRRRLVGAFVAARDGIVPRRRDVRALTDTRIRAAGRAAACHRVAAARVLLLSLELQRERLSDRTGIGVPGGRAHLVGFGGHESGVLSRRANAWRACGLPDPAGCDSRCAAFRVRWALHGARRIVPGAHRRGDDGRESGP